MVTTKKKISILVVVITLMLGAFAVMANEAFAAGSLRISSVSGFAQKSVSRGQQYVSIHGNWKKASGAKKYEVQYCIAGKAGKFTTSSTSFSSPAFKISKNRSGSVSYKVRAVNGKAVGPWKTKTIKYGKSTTGKWY